MQQDPQKAKKLADAIRFARFMGAILLTLGVAVGLNIRGIGDSFSPDGQTRLVLSLVFITMGMVDLLLLPVIFKKYGSK